MSRPFCKVCVELKVEKPRYMVNNGVCKQHGAVRKYCVVCLVEKPENPTEVDRNNRCKHHNTKLVPCRVCIEEYVEPPNMVTVGFCTDHKGHKLKPRCKECVKQKVEEPKMALKDGLCTKHGGKFYCTECIKLGVKDPKQDYNNGLCIKHGAEKRYCTECLKIGENMKLAQKEKLCLRHYYNLTGEKVCIRCVQYGIEPKPLHSKYLCLEHQHTFSTPCEICIESKCEKINVAKKNGVCRKHTEKDKCSKCQENPKNPHKQGLCTDCSKESFEICYKCQEKDIKSTKQAVKLGLCKDCGEGLPEFKCQKDNCFLPLYKQNWCKKCYYVEFGEKLSTCKKCENLTSRKYCFKHDIKPLCCIYNCNSMSRIEGKCFKHASDEYKRKVYIRQQKYEKEQYQNNPNFKLAKLLRCRLKDLVQTGKMIKQESSLALVGCTVDKLKQYLEDMFEPGMTWENHGEWHIDHIRPCSSFNLEKHEEKKQCFYYTNLQPLWAYDNLSKGNKFSWEIEDNEEDEEF